MEPTVGRIVHVYYRKPGTTDGLILRPGIVLEVVGGLVHVRVFFTSAGDVTLALPIDAGKPGDYGRYWTWPPTARCECCPGWAGQGTARQGGAGQGKGGRFHDMYV